MPTVSKPRLERSADWLMIIGAVALLLSLFATWSHQLPPSLLAHGGGTGLFHAVPRDPTGWQVYSIADVLLGVLAAGLVSCALAGSRGARLAVLAGLGVAIAFTLHALSDPPTNGVTIFDPRIPAYVADAATAGFGETLALAGLGAGLAGLLASFVAD